MNKGTSTESSPFLKELVKKVAQIHGKSENDLNLTSEKATLASNEDNDSIAAKGGVENNLLVVVIIVVLAFLCLCLCGLYLACNLCRKKETKWKKRKSVEMKINSINVEKAQWGESTLNPMYEGPKTQNNKNVQLV